MGTATKKTRNVRRGVDTESVIFRRGMIDRPYVGVLLFVVNHRNMDRVTVVDSYAYTVTAELRVPVQHRLVPVVLAVDMGDI